MKISSNSRKKVYMSIFLFLALYAPPFLPRINFSHVMSFCSILALFLSYRDDLKHIFNERAIIKFNTYIICIFFYWCIIFFIHYCSDDIINTNNYLVIGYRFFSTIFIFEPVAIYICAWTKRNSLKIEDIVECITVSGMIEATISLFALIFPSIKAILAQIIIANTGYYDHFVKYSWMMNNSFYGFAAGMTDYFGLLTGLIAGLCFFYAIDKKTKYMLCIPFLLLATILNATTGVIIFLIAIMLTVKLEIRRKISIKTIILIPVSMIAIIITYNVIMSYKASSIQKILDNFWEIFDQSKVTMANTSMRVLLSNDFWTLPSNKSELILGTGHSLLRAEGFKGSDVGYINDIWSFGIVGSTALYITYFKLFSSIPSSNFIFIKAKYLFLISFFIFNIKGLSFGMNSGNFIMILFTMLLITQNARNGRTEDLLCAKMN